MQLELFARTDEERDAAAAALRPRVRKPRMPASRWVQLDLLATAWLNRYEPRDDEPEEDDPFVTAPLVHRIVPAHLVPKLETVGIRSVFEFGISVVTVKGRQEPDDSCDQASTPKPPPRPQEQRHGRTVREVGITRHIAMRHDETEEWQERERLRRSRQRVPRPSQRSRTRGRKLLDLIGTRSA